MEIAASLNVDASTFRSFVMNNRNIGKILIRAKSEMKRDLRTAQFNMAMDTETKFQGPMLIWLGKQHLGQTDRDAMAPEPIPGIEESQDVRTFADLSLSAGTMDGPPIDVKQLSAKDDPFVVDAEFKEISDE
ncbi:MAG: hypothetical protein JKY94_16840 [Rhodobacteraceae bacterium]|nr:hypothetical protein [Paracoccaceae bacterium]